MLYGFMLKSAKNNKREYIMVKKVVSLVFGTCVNDSRVLKEAQSLKSAGFDITIAAVHEPLLKEEETLSGIDIKRIKLKFTPNGSYGSRFINLEYLFNILRNFKSIDIYHCNDLNTLFVGVFIKLLINRNSKIVYDAHEYETERAGFSKLQKTYAKLLEKFFIKYVDLVITVSESIANDYIKLYNIKKPTLVMNCPKFKDTSKSNIFRDKFGISQDKTIFLYQGLLTQGRGIEILLEYFKNEKNNVIVFMGHGKLTGKVLSYSKKYPNNIYLHPSVPLDEVISHTASADFGIALIENICLSYYYCMPNKLFEFLMAGLPVIVSNSIEMKNFVNKNQVGIAMNTNNIEGLKEAINNIISLDKNKLIENVNNIKKSYSWEEQEKILINEYKLIGK